MSVLFTRSLIVQSVMVLENDIQY